MSARRGIRLGCGCLAVAAAGACLWVGVHRFIMWSAVAPVGRLSQTVQSPDGRFEMRAYRSGGGVLQDEHMEVYARQLGGSDQALRCVYHGLPVTIAVADSAAIVMKDEQSGVVYRYPLDTLRRTPVERMANVTWKWAPLVLAGLALLLAGLTTVFASPRVRADVKDDPLAGW